MRNKNNSSHNKKALITSLIKDDLTNIRLITGMEKLGLWITINTIYD